MRDFRDVARRLERGWPPHELSIVFGNERVFGGSGSGPPVTCMQAIACNIGGRYHERRMPQKVATQDRIMQAFLDLVVKHGYDGTTTRAVAETAGVNEVTLFRHFGDKESLARAAFNTLGPAPVLAAYEPAIDLSSPARALEGLCDCLLFLCQTIQNHPIVLNPALSEYFHRADNCQEMALAPVAMLDVIRRALAQAEPVLRSDVNREVTAMSLLGLTIVAITGQEFGYLSLARYEGNTLFVAALRPLINWTAESEPD